MSAKAVLLCLLSLGLALPVFAQETKSGEVSIHGGQAAKKKRPSRPDAIQDTEDGFFNDENSSAPEDPDTDTNNSGNYQQDDGGDQLIESNQTPDDDGIEYAEEAEKNENERQKRLQERKKALQPARPPVDEPMPLIKRQRETVDLNTKQPNTYIRHPYAKKGLTKITKDKTYIYKTKNSDQTRASSFRFGMLSFQNLQNPETGLIFEEFYDGGNFALLYDYEWQLYRTLGKFGIKAGTGLGLASGRGRFENDTNGAIEPKERFTFALFPNTLGAILRLHFWEDQLIIPYGEGGGALFAFGELRDDGKNPKFGAAFGGYFAVGVNVNMKYFDPISMIEMDREYSINNVYLGAEYRYYIGAGNFDFTGNLINGGVTIEF